MSISIQIGLRYFRAKKRSTVSMITVIAVGGVALGVAALLAVLSITSGFQQAFQDKVLGVNAHVLVLKYGLDFDEYRDVVALAKEMPRVAGAAPFVINEMMLAKGDRIGGILVKGIDPERMPTVLDLPEQMVAGTLDGLRVSGAEPPVHPDDLDRTEDDDLDAYLRDLVATQGVDTPREEPTVDAGARSSAQDEPSDEPLTEEQMEVLRQRIATSDTPLFEEGPDSSTVDSPAEEPLPHSDTEIVEALPQVEVPSLEEAMAALQELSEGDDELPTDDVERELFEQDEDEVAQADDCDVPGIVVGVTLADNLGVAVGDRVRVISPLAGLDTSMWSAQARTPRSKEFQVIGVFEAGFQEYDSRLVYVDLHEAQSFFDQGDTVTGVEIRLHDLNEASDVALKIERELGGGPFHTMDWQELNHNLFTALEIQKIMLSLVIATIIVVAAFNVIATLIMLVIEKKREVAILKAMGAQDRHILEIFFMQGAIIGLVGTLFGLALGGGVVAYLTKYEFPLDPKVYLIDHLPVHVSPLVFVVTVLVAFLICAVATLIPSWWAARLLPADGVRYE